MTDQGSAPHALTVKAGIAHILKEVGLYLVPHPATFALFDGCAIERAVGDGAGHLRWR